MPDTCNRCRRPMAADESEWNNALSVLCVDIDLVFWMNQDTAKQYCARARDRWLTARISELEAQVLEVRQALSLRNAILCDENAGLRLELAEARKPRWSALDHARGGEIRRLMLSREYLGAQVRRADGVWRWTAYPAEAAAPVLGRGVCATETEAKAAAEKACSVETTP